MTTKVKILEKSAEFYKMIFDLVPASIVIIDKQGKTLDVNSYHINSIGRGQIKKEDYLKFNFLDHPSIKASGLQLKYNKVLSGEPFEEKNVFFPETTGGPPGYFNIKASPIFDGEEIIGALMIHEDVTEQNIRTKELEEANIALKILLEETKNVRKKIEGKILDNINLLVLPYIDELNARLQNTPELSFLDVITQNLESITSSFVENLRSEFSNLTPREIQITTFIRQGKTNKDIARLLNLSVRTIEFYRSNLRKKFNIKNKKITLHSFLANNS